MISLFLPLVVLVGLPLMLAPPPPNSGPTALVGGCFLGHVALIAYLAQRGAKPWLARIVQASLLVAASGLALCAGQSLAGRPMDRA